MSKPEPGYSVSNLQKFLDQNMVGQERAVSAFCDLVRISQTLSFLWQGSGKKRNLGTLLFLGPSGVGKTLLAELVSLFYHGSREVMVLKGAEYSEKFTISRLIGPPPGYLGYDRIPLFAQENLDKYSNGPEISPSNNELTPEEQSLFRQYHVFKDKIEQTRTSLKFKEELLKMYEKHFNTKAEEIKKATRLDRRTLEEGQKTIQQEMDKIQKNILEAGRDYRQTEEHFHLLTDEIEQSIKNIEARVPYKQTQQPPTDWQRPVIILADEIEQMHENILNLFYFIARSATLRMANGSITDFSNCFLLMTSNVAADKIEKELRGTRMGFAASEITDQELDKRIWGIAFKELKRFLKIPLINRIDKIVLFRPLNEDHFQKIFDLELKEYMAKLREVKIHLEIARDLKEFIIKESRDHPEQGARLLEGKIRSIILNSLASFLLQMDNSFEGRIKMSYDANNNPRISYHRFDSSN